jgi:hypothetical protein
LENDVFVDQRRVAVEQFVAAHRQQLLHQGAIVPKWRQRGARKVGPYFLLVVRGADGRQHSVYLGQPGPLVDEVRQMLADLQAPNTERRQLALVRKQLRTALKQSKQQLDRELAKAGLYRKGHEIRGWSRAVPNRTP